MVVKNAGAAKSVVPILLYCVHTKPPRAAWRKAAKYIQSRLPETVRPTHAQLQPILVRSGQRHPLHRLAQIKQGQGRWYTTHSLITSTIRRFVTTASRSGVKFDKSTFPRSRIGTIVQSQSGRAPFASTLRPNLTGGTLNRTAGGYAHGSGRTGGARYFSHGPTAPAQVISNVSQAVRAFLVGGKKAQFDGVDPHTGEKRFKAVSTLQNQLSHSPQQRPRTTSGSYIAFNINPTVTALTPLKAVRGFASSDQQQKSLKSEGLLDILATDFSQAVKDLAAVLHDLQQLSQLGDLPIVYEHSTLKVHFPGCDMDTVEALCDDLQVQSGVVQQDSDFDAFVGTEIALLFPFAPSRTPSECEFFDRPVEDRQHVQPVIDWQHMLSPLFDESEADSTQSERSYDQIHEFLQDGHAWLSPSPSGYESLHTSEAEEADLQTPLEYWGTEGIYRFTLQRDSRLS